MEIVRLKELITLAKGADSQIQKDINECKEKQEFLKNKQTLLEQSQSFLQNVAKKTQEKLRFQVEEIVNIALETCFPNEYKFKINFNISRGKTDAELVFESRKTGLQVDPMSACGGGVVDITAFALRIAAYAIERDTDNVIVFDEPFRFLSKDIQHKAGSILKALSEKLNLQIILVTHINELIDVADRVFTVKKNEETKISKIFVENA